MCEQRLLEHMGSEEEFRKSELRRDKEDKWQAFQDYDKNVKWYPGFRNNQSGVKYNIITKVPTDEYEEKRVNAENMKKRQEDDCIYNATQLNKFLFLLGNQFPAHPHCINLLTGNSFESSPLLLHTFLDS